jgi:hypothetical protein
MFVGGEHTAFVAVHHAHEAGLVAIIRGAIRDGELSDGVDGHLRYLNVFAKIAACGAPVSGRPRASILIELLLNGEASDRLRG